MCKISKLELNSTLKGDIPSLCGIKNCLAAGKDRKGGSHVDNRAVKTVWEKTMFLALRILDHKAVTTVHTK